MIIEITRIEAQSYAEALVHLTAIWYAGKKHDKRLLAKHLGQYNSLRGLIGKLNNAIRENEDAPQASGVEFDVDLARENEVEAQKLG
jgi:hypothetical protein